MTTLSALEAQFISTIPPSCTLYDSSGIKRNCGIFETSLTCREVSQLCGIFPEKTELQLNLCQLSRILRKFMNKS